MLNTPILLITFNRPDHTRQVLERILEAQPKELYVFQDGARSLTPAPSPEGDGRVEHPDVAKCQQVRDVISSLTLTFPNTKLHTYFSEANLGCGAGPMTGISWFFDNVEQGIVMEDDCFAHPDFFPYCEELLNRYKGSSVKFINSTLYDDRWTKALGEEARGRGGERYSYEYSRYMCTGAWASYREVWQGFDLDLKTLKACKFYRHVRKLTHNIAEAEWWWYQVRSIQEDNSKKSYWDYQMQIHLFRQNALTIHPAVNLISNIGFDPEGTHTRTNDGRGDKEVYPILPLVHPMKVEADWKRDAHCWAKKQPKGWFMDTLFEIYHIYAWRKKKAVR